MRLYKTSAAKRAAVRRWVRANPEKARASHQRWLATNPEYMRAAVRRYAGLPIPPHPAPELCDCCGRPPGKRAMSLDHDHATGWFRGWLCSNCNTGVGMLQDSFSGVINALHYFQRVYNIHETDIATLYGWPDGEYPNH